MKVTLAERAEAVLETTGRVALEPSFAQARMTKRMEVPPVRPLTLKRKLAKAQEHQAEHWLRSLELGPMRRALVRLQTPRELRKPKPERTSPHRLENSQARERVQARARPVAKAQEVQPERWLPKKVLAWRPTQQGLKKLGELLARTKSNAYLPRSLRARAALGRAALRERQAFPVGTSSRA